MGATIDERVAGLRFDNKQFETNAAASINTLDKLNKGLELDGAIKGIKNLDTSTKSFSLNGISSGIETISSKFTALGIIGMTTLSNITNSAVNAGKRIASALTIDPITTGFSEYETKINAIQTILTNTAQNGTKLKDVTAALNELNTYADQTIYNFSEMTRNVGTFTAAGIDLKTSTEAIKGIANLAAGSGSTSVQASSAMYQLSQAMASGTVKLMDWNSVVNAGMGGQLFQKALEKTAKELGHGRDMSVSFRESLESGWITTEVLTKTLQKFAKDPSLVDAATKIKTVSQLFDTMKESVQSGWAISWENIIGNKDEATATLTAISNGFNNIVGKSSDARNATLQFWKENGGRTAMVQGLANVVKGLGSVIIPIKEAFRDIFPAMTGKRLVEITENFRDLTAKFKIGEETSKNLKNTFKGLFAIFDIAKQACGAVIEAIAPLFGYFVKAGDGVLGFTGRIGELIVSFDDTIKKSDAFTKIFSKIGDFLKPIADKVRDGMQGIKDAFNSIKDADTSGVDTFTDKVKVRFEPFTKLFDFLKGTISLIGAIVKKVAPIFAALASVVGKGLGKMQEDIATAIETSDFNGIVDLINGGLLGALLIGLKKFVDSLSSITSKGGGMLGGIKDILDGVKGSLEAYQQSIQAGTLLKIAVAMGILALSLVAISMIDSERLSTSLAAMATMFAQLFGSMAVFSKIMGGKGFKGMIKISIAMIGLSVAVLLLATAMQKISKLDWKGIAKGLTAVGVLCAMLVTTSLILSKNKASLVKGSVGIILFATSMLILAEAVEKLGSLDLKMLAKGLGGVGIILAELTLFTKTSNLDGLGLRKGGGLLLLAVAVNILATAVKKFGELDVATLAKGLGAIGIVLVELALFTKLTGNAKKVITTAAGLTILAAAMLIFGDAIEKMGSLSIEQIGKGLLTMAVGLGLVTTALNFMPKNMILTGTGLVLVSASLKIMASALQDMGSLSMSEIAKGLLALAGSLTIITVALNFMKKGLPGAAAMLIMAAALALFVPELKALGNMSVKEIAKGLGSLVGVFAVLGGAAVILGPLTPVILALSGALALFGVGCLAVGVGMLAFSAALTALSISGTAGAAALVIIVTSLIGLIPMVGQKIGEAVINFANIIIKGAPTIAGAINSVILAMADVLMTSGPVLIESIVSFIANILQTFADHVPDMVNSGMQILIGFLKGIADNIYLATQEAINIVTNFLNGVASKLPDIIQAGFNLIISFINGLADGIKNNTDRLLSAIRNLFGAVLLAAVKTLFPGVGELLKLGQKIMDNGFFQGLKDKFGAVVEFFRYLPRKCIDGIKEGIKGFYYIGTNIIDGIIQGINDGVSAIVNKIKEIAGNCIDAIKDALGIHSPSKEFANIGKYMDEGLVVGLQKYSNLSSEAAKNVGLETMDAMNDSISKISLGGLDTRPTIRPVLDLTEVLKGTNQIDGLLANKQAMAISANIAASSAKKSTNDALSDTIFTANAQSDGKIISAIERASNVINDFVSTFSGMSVVMDSGELVGTIAPKMDLALGQTRTYKGRGI